MKSVDLILTVDALEELFCGHVDSMGTVPAIGNAQSTRIVDVEADCRMEKTWTAGALPSNQCFFAKGRGMLNGGLIAANDLEQYAD